MDWTDVTEQSVPKTLPLPLSGAHSDRDLRRLDTRTAAVAERRKAYLAGRVAAGVRNKTADPEWMASTVLHSSLCHSLGLKKSQLSEAAEPKEIERENGSGELL